MEPHRLALPVGFQIEHFRIEAVLGKGGFGITYLVVDLQLGKRVAIKELLPDTIATRIEGLTVVPHSLGMQENWEWARDRFLEEARTLATFSHPAIVGVHRLIEANGTVYMVMDYIEGESYEARLQRIGTEPNQASLMAVIGPILSGLEEVHAHGLLHRDIKPENILIDKRGQPVLIDFGSARESVGKTMTMTSIVTHGYSPIEQYQTKGRMGPWTDIYAIAAVMSRAIAGEKPPVASDRVLDDSYESLVIRVSSHYSHEFCFAVDRALEVRPEERPQSILEWKQQLSVDPDSGTRWAEERPTTESSNLKAQCPHCAQRVEMDWSMQSSLVECPNCRETFRAGGEQNEEEAHPIKPPPVTPRKKSKLPVVATAVCAGLLLLGFAVTLLRPSDPDTLREQGRKLLQGEDAAKDAIKAIGLLEQAADKGDVEAQLLLGKTFSKDNEGGPAKDLPVSFKWFSKAADQGNAEAQNEVGWMLDEGRGVERDDAKATALYKASSESGYPPARYNYALMLRGGEGVTKDEAQAQRLLDDLTEDEEKQVFAWYKSLSENGDPRAQGHLAGMYETGFGHPKDEMLAAEWQKQSSAGLLKLAEDGDVEAMISTAWHYLDGDGLPKDESLGASWFRKAAEKGSAEAQVHVGTMYLQGNGVAKDEAKAVEWFRKAADQGSAIGQIWMGNLYAVGRGVPKNELEAVKWFRKAADQGNAEAQTHLGTMHFEGRGVPRDEARAIEWYRKAAEQEFAGGQHSLGLLYEAGRGVGKDDAEAVKWFRKAAEQQLAEAEYCLGSMYLVGRGVSTDDKEAAKWLSKSAEQGYAEAQVLLGSMYANGRGVVRDEAKAVEWYRKAADQGLAGGQAALGLTLLQGHGVTKNDAEAVKWFRKAAEQGFAEAENYLGSMYAEGIGVTKDQAKALEWYRKAAEQGNAEAQTNLGRMYAQGRGVTKDEAEAAKWYRKAADQGDVGAQCLLGTMYEGGLGVTKNHVKAVEWYRKAAEQGNAGGQLLLGTLYAQGRGVPIDESKAVEWYRKAADQGLAAGQLLLGTMYAQGRGLTKDEEKAAQWYRKAAEQGDQQAKDLLLQLESGRQNSTPDPTTGLAAINQKLDRTIIPRMSLTDATVRETVEFLERQSGINDPNPGQGGGRGIKIALTLDSQSASQTITTDLKDIPLRIALDYVTRLANLRVAVTSQGVSILPLSSTAQPAASANVKYAIPVAGKPGFVTSPYAPNTGFVDVRGFQPGTEVKDPYTGRPFLVP